MLLFQIQLLSKFYYFFGVNVEFDFLLLSYICTSKLGNFGSKLTLMPIGIFFLFLGLLSMFNFHL